MRDKREEEGDLFVRNGSFTDAISSRCGSTLHDPAATSRELPGHVLPAAADSAALVARALFPRRAQDSVFSPSVAGSNSLQQFYLLLCRWRRTTALQLRDPMLPHGERNLNLVLATTNRYLGSKGARLQVSQTASQ